MSQFTLLFNNHSFWILVAAYWVFSAAVGALQKPTDKNGPFYTWAFTFLNTLAGNLSRAFSSKIPGVMPVVALCVGLLAISGCAAQKPIAQHPGAINSFDSYAYDTLLTSQSVIEDAKVKFVGNADAKLVINEAIAAYDAAQASYKIYHASKGDPQALAGFQKALDDLIQAVGLLKKQFASSLTVHSVTTTMVRVADPNEEVAIGGRIYNIRDLMAVYQ